MVRVRLSNLLRDERLDSFIYLRNKLSSADIPVSDLSYGAQLTSTEFAFSSLLDSVAKRLACPCRIISPA